MKLFKILILFIVTGLLSCQSQVKFDQTKWRFKEDPAFPPQLRKAMLGDLLANYKLTTMSHPQVISLLGEPDYSDDSTLSYKIGKPTSKCILLTGSDANSFAF